MAIGIRKTKEFQVFLAGWSARQRFDETRKGIAIPTADIREIYRAFETFLARRSVEQLRTRTKLKLKV